MSKNQHIHDYLKYYLSFDQPPYYAVMINGPWGIGKTYLVKEVLKSLTVHGGGRQVYLSLFGISNAEEIDAALFRAVHPILGSKGANIAGRIGKGLAKKFLIDPDIKAAEVIPEANIGLYIFDDIERCDMPINKVLGYINEIVEHEGRKVIVIANENEIENSEAYRRRREKIVGKTLEVESVLEDALVEFIARIADKAARDFLEKNSGRISTAYQQSELNNLRILQQTIWDFERVFQVLTEPHKANEDALHALLSAFCSLSFEVKAGRLEATDLQMRSSRIYRAVGASGREAESSPIDRAAGRYPGSNVFDDVLSDQTLIDVLIRGVVEGASINECLEQSKYFVTRAKEPAWRTVWFGLERDDSDFSAAASEMENEFKSRKFLIPGEIMHVSALRLWLSDLGVLSDSRADIVKQCKRYIDDLLAQDRLRPMGSGISDDTGMRGYGGLGWMDSGSPEFRELYAYLQDKRRKAAEAKYPSLAQELLIEMQTDPDLFYRRLCVTNSDDGKYLRTPILAAVDPQKFVDVALGLEAKKQGPVFKMFSDRYNAGELDRDLSAEKPWLEKVRTELEGRMVGASAITKWRIGKYIEWHFVPLLDPSEPAVDQAQN